MERFPSDTPGDELIEYKDSGHTFSIHTTELAKIKRLFELVENIDLDELRGQYSTSEGVTIHEGNVVEVRLAVREQASPLIFPVILQFEHLERLMLSGDFTEIPPGIQTLKHLRGLLLTCPKLTQLPEEIGNISSLTELKLSLMELLEAIPENFHNLVNLEKLILFQLKNATFVPRIFSNLRRLEYLELHDLALHGDLDWIPQNQALKYLRMQNVDLQSLPADIGRCKKLEHLSLSRMPLLGVPESLGTCILLKELYITKTSIKLIPASLGNLHDLTSILMYDNQITDIQANFKDCHRLAHVSIYNNKLASFPPGIEYCKALENLALDDNKIAAIPENIGQCEQLRELLLANNCISRLSESIGDLKHLFRLDLGNNDLTEIPASIGGLESLGALGLDHNRLTSIPDEIGLLPRLGMLSLVGNPLEPPATKYLNMCVEEAQVVMRKHLEERKAMAVNSRSSGASHQHSGTRASSGAASSAAEAVNVIYGYIILKNGGVVMPCLAITTRRFWDEQHRVPEMEEWEQRYFPEELAAIEHVVDDLQLAEIVEGIFEFHPGTPDGEARHARAQALWREQQFDELFLLHGKIVEKDLKPALERLGAVEVPQISEHLRNGYFSQ